MEKNKVYTQEEVLKNIETYRKKEEDLINQRKDINKELLNVRKQKEHWINLDLSQLKLL